jgi:hypothetical protein
MNTTSPEREWRCRSCSILLGVEREGRLHLKYKSAQYIVTGPVTAICRRCQTNNETVTPRADAGAAKHPDRAAVGPTTTTE